MFNKDLSQMTGSGLTPYERLINVQRILSSVILVVFVLLLFLSGIFFVNEGFSKTAVSLFFTLVLDGFFYVLNKMGKYRAAGLGLFLVVSGVLTYNLLVFDGIYDIAMLAYPAVIVFAGMIFGRRYVGLITAVVIGQISLVYYASVKGFTQPYFDMVETQFQHYITNVLLIVITGGLLWVVMNLIEKNINKVLQSKKRLQEVYEETLEGWGHALELRDKETEGHTRRVMNLTNQLALQIGCSEEQIKNLRRGALLHDIGKMVISDDILLKPERLVEEELKNIRKHPQFALDLLEDISYLEEALVIPRCHHERWDGSGYPQGLKGNEIPLEARIFAIVDVYDALISERPYSPAWSETEAIEYIRSNAGILFDPQIVQSFIALVDEPLVPT